MSNLLKSIALACILLPTGCGTVKPVLAGSNAVADSPNSADTGLSLRPGKRLRAQHLLLGDQAEAPLATVDLELRQPGEYLARDEVDYPHLFSRGGETSRASASFRVAAADGCFRLQQGLAQRPDRSPTQGWGVSGDSAGTPPASCAPAMAWDDPAGSDKAVDQDGATCPHTPATMPQWRFDRSSLVPSQPAKGQGHRFFYPLARGDATALDASSRVFGKLSLPAQADIGVEEERICPH